MIRNCVICNNEFSVYPAHVKRGGGIYCSRKCQGEAQSKRLLGRVPENGLAWKGRGIVDKKCLQCGKDITVKKWLEKKKFFCSSSCSAIYHAKDRIKTGTYLNCVVCDTPFYRNPSAINRESKKPKYCSHKCRAMDSVRHQKKSDTNIEKIIQDWLTENNIEYAKQKVVRGIALVDFFLSPNTCLFVDGDYWHSLPKRILLDKKQRDSLLSFGYNVLSLKGSQILNGERFNEILQ